MLVEHGGGLQIVDRFNVFPGGEPTHVIDVAHNAKINCHFREQIVQIFHHEYGSRHIRDVLAIFSVLPGFRLKHGKMRLHEIDIDHAQIVLKSDPAMPVGVKGTLRNPQQDGQSHEP